MEFAVAVLGGGPGGYVAAIRCSQLGLKTVLIEADELGGTCLNRGCIPAKALLHSAEIYKHISTSESFGIIADNIRYDFQKMVQRKNAVVERLRNGIAYLEKAHRVTVIKGFGTLRSANLITVNDEEIHVGRIILATGSVPSRPPIPGKDGKLVMTSDEVLSMTSIPQSLIIIGGGVIGIEFATLFATLGISVTVLELMPSILPGVDDEIIKLLSAELHKKKVKLVSEAQVVAIESGDCCSVRYVADGREQTVSAAACIVCTGRSPATKGIGLESIGIEMAKQFVKVNSRMQTNISNIYAIGDITGTMQLAHVASAQGLVAAENCAGHSKEMRQDIVPACIYTSPEIAFVGKNGKQLAEEGACIKTGRFLLSGNGKSLIMGENTGIVKIFSDEDSGAILGAQIMAPRATDMIMEIAVAMRCKGTIGTLMETIHPHPTICEAILEAVHDTDDLCCHAAPKPV
jgi:dihydrolipoamide dehydrogenase